MRKVYTDCSCLPESNETRAWWSPDTDTGLPSPLATDSNTGAGMAIDGHCPFDCSRQFTMILGMLTAFSFLGSTGRIGNQLLSLRAVEPRDKAAGLIIMVSLLSLLVFLPSPIIFANIMGNTEKTFLLNITLLKSFLRQCLSCVGQ